MGREFHPVPQWTREQLDSDRVTSENLFKIGRRTEGPKRYASAFDSILPDVKAALEMTGDLRSLSASILTENPELWRILRYFCGPQISEEDFWTLVGRKFRSMPSESAEAAADVLEELLDSRRLPWLAGSRVPTPAERSAAELATATLLAHERLRTERRGKASRAQEADVRSALAAVGFTRLRGSKRSEINLLDDLPKGHFSAEQKVGGAKCDVPVRLHDGRLLAVECKVSNGPKNGWKRLLRETGGKSDTWREHFGKQILTCAVIAGVYDLSCLVKAQEEHKVVVFWHHDLNALQDFVESAR